jgi:hypothetical protein
MHQPAFAFGMNQGDRYRRKNGVARFAHGDVEAPLINTELLPQMFKHEGIGLVANEEVNLAGAERNIPQLSSNWRTTPHIAFGNAWPELA